LKHGPQLVFTVVTIAAVATTTTRANEPTAATTAAAAQNTRMTKIAAESVSAPRCSGSSTD
jgi:hypothetical protein